MSGQDLETLFRYAAVITFFISVAALFVRMGAMTKKFEMIGKQQAEEISQLKDNVSKINDLLVAQARTDERLANIVKTTLLTGERVDRLTVRVDELTVKVIAWLEAKVLNHGSKHI